MAKIKVKDQEYDVPDEVAALVADEGGVPFRNRAAEYRRKQEKFEKELEDLKAKPAATPPAQPPVRQQVQAPYNPGYYQVPAQQFQAPIQPAFTAEDAREIAREEARRLRNQDEFQAEQLRLREEWASFEDEKDAAADYLRTKGYDDDQIKGFGPRDWRLVKDAMSASKPKTPPKRSPQEVVLDTAGGGGVEDLTDSPYAETKIANWNRDKLREEIQKAKSRPRLGDE